ncbi:MAG: AAA family ATPase [bacterium]|nr:AAA family ATPase [bacterium]
MKIPYGVADFYSLRTEGNLYVDRTDRIAVVEDLGKSLLFLRPRRFGKSLWLSALACYYDLALEGEHQVLFGDLAIGREPTPLAHRYFVLRWDFSEIDPDPPPRGVNAGVSSRHQRLANQIHGYLLGSVKGLVSDYEAHLPRAVEIEDDAFRTLDNLLAVIRQTPYRLYLLIDEYDNFANEVLSVDKGAYEDLVHSDGPFKHLFKWVKAAMGRKGVDRLFITGVSPMVMADVTSGMNIARNVYLKPVLADLCGFTEEEIGELLAAVLDERGDCELTAQDAKLMMREWYNGYRFALGVPERVYNPTLVFYFLLHLLEEGTCPRQMLDSNLAADEGKLDYLARVTAGQRAVGGQAAGDQTGQGTVIDLIRKQEPLEVRRLLDRFTLKELLEHSAQDTSFFGSYLFYLGMLTLSKDATEEQAVELVVPNEVMHGLYVERIRKILMPLGASRSAADAILFAFLRSGDLEPLLDFIEATLFPTFSNRDATWANELTVKTVFLTLLWNDSSYIIHSEPELDHRYADLCLLRRPDARESSLWDLLFEFKRLSLKELGMSGKDVKAASRAALMKLTKVKDALDQAEAQIVAYRTALGRSRGDTLKLCSFAVVALGFERLVVRPSRAGG